MKRIGVYLSGIVSAFAFVLIFQTNSAFAATITPTTTAASGGPGDCTLADAFEAASTNTAVNGCPAGQAYPVVDVVMLGNNTYHIDNTVAPVISEAVTVRGTSMAGSRIASADENGLEDAAIDVSINTPANQTQTISFEDLTFDIAIGDYMSIKLYDDTHANVSLLRVRDETNGAQSGEWKIIGYYDSTSTVSIQDSQLGRVLVGQYDDAQLTSTIENTYLHDEYVIEKPLLTVDTNTPRPGNTTVTSSEIHGVANTTMVAVRHMNPLANDQLHINDSVVSGAFIGLRNEECNILSDVNHGSLYLTNSMVGGDGMTVGLFNACGHAVVRDSTFHDINGSAVVVYTNPLDEEDGRASSRFESYNSTYTGISVDGNYFWPDLDTLNGTYLEGVIVFSSDVDSPVSSGSHIEMTHNTFADNTFDEDEYTTLFFDEQAHLATFIFRNNAIEGTAMRGTYAATTKTVNNNMTTGAASAGIAHVNSLGLDVLMDNGGVHPLGVDGASGNVLTMRPLATSVLIDGAPYAGLTADERGVARSLLAAYDVGAVEVTMAEYLDDGGVWPRPSNPSDPSTPTDIVVPTAPNAGAGQLLRIDAVLMPLAGITLLLVVLRYIWRRHAAQR